MTVAQFTEILEEETSNSWNGDNFVQGLGVICKYIDPQKETVVGCAEHDIIYTVGVEDLVKAEITEEDVKELRRLNWMISEDSLTCFV